MKRGSPNRVVVAALIGRYFWLVFLLHSLKNTQDGAILGIFPMQVKLLKLFAMAIVLVYSRPLYPLIQRVSKLAGCTK